MSTTPPNTAATRFRTEAGLRLRWLREAYEKKEPGRHSQRQWADALGISQFVLNRIELGNTTPPAEVIARIVYSTWASPGYWMFGVIGDGWMPAWLEESLMEGHALHLTLFDVFLRRRESAALAVRPPEARKRAKRRKRRAKSA